MSGFVYVKDFDKGLIETLGGELVTVRLEGREHQRYAIDIPGAVGPPEYGEKIPVFLVVGLSAFTPQFYPSLVLRRTSGTHDFSLGGAWYPVESIRPAPNTTMVDVVGPTGIVRTGPRYVEVQQRATPQRLEYTGVIESRGDRAQHDAHVMYQFLGEKILPPGGPLFLTDSLGDRRSYECLVEHSNDLSALDLLTRGAIYTFNYTVYAEIDFQRAVVMPTVTGTHADVTGK